MPKKIKVYHLSTHDVQGGASRAAFRLHKSLNRSESIDSKMLVKHKHYQDDTIIESKPSNFHLASNNNSIIFRLIRKIRNEAKRLKIISPKFHQDSISYYKMTRPDGYEQFTDDRTLSNEKIANELREADIINLHWVSGFIYYPYVLPLICKSKPVVWTFHDMNALTGGCHYTLGCENYKNQCGKCPQLGSNDSYDLSYQILKRKYNSYSRILRENLHIIALSNWMEQEINQHQILRQFSVTIVPNGLSTNDFSVRNGTYLRNTLKIENTQKIILFIANRINNRRKGFDLLVNAINTIQNKKDICLLLLGTNQPLLDLNIKYISLGQIHDDNLLSLIYSMADLFVISSRQDNLPNTVVESMACGTPVIGFQVGGIPDMVRKGVTGLLSPAEDYEALGKAIRKLLDNDELRKKMSTNCREIAVQEYSLEIQAKRYIELYKEILKRNSSQTQ